MKKIVLYWNNICILHNQEKIYLEALKNQLLKHDIDLSIRCFGLGYPEHISDYLKREDAILPDLIVSSDLEVFEDSQIYSQKINSCLYPVADWFALKEGPLLQAVWKSEKLLPFLAIPLMAYSRKNQQFSLLELLNEDITFGGIENSAAKVVLKTIWDKYGKETAKEFGMHASITDMPINAFQRVRTGQSQTAIVPSIYAMRADQQTTYQVFFKEGIFALPTYICAFKSAKEEVIRQVLEQLLTLEFCDFYVNQGNLICYIKGSDSLACLPGKEPELLYPGGTWFENVDSETFYGLYDEVVRKKGNAVPDSYQSSMLPQKSRVSENRVPVY